MWVSSGGWIDECLTVKTMMVRVDSLDVGVGDVELEKPDVLEVLWVGEPAIGEQPGWEGLRLGGSHSEPGPLLRLSHVIHEMNGVRRRQSVERKEEQDVDLTITFLEACSKGDKNVLKGNKRLAIAIHKKK